MTQNAGVVDEHVDIAALESLLQGVHRVAAAHIDAVDDLDAEPLQRIAGRTADDDDVIAAFLAESSKFEAYAAIRSGNQYGGHLDSVLPGLFLLKPAPTARRRAGRPA